MFKSMIVIETVNDEIAAEQFIAETLAKEYPDITFKIKAYTLIDKGAKFVKEVVKEIKHKKRGRPKGSGKKHRGRPKGSKNKPKVETIVPPVGTSTPTPKKRGRPKGSKNTPKAEAPLTTSDLRKEAIEAAADRVNDKSVEECREESKDFLKS